MTTEPVHTAVEEAWRDYDAGVANARANLATYGNVWYLKAIAQLRGVVEEAVVATERARLVAALTSLVDVISNEGPHPEYHREQIARLQSEWPLLWSAIEELLRGSSE